MPGVSIKPRGRAFTMKEKIELAEDAGLQITDGPPIKIYSDGCGISIAYNGELSEEAKAHLQRLEERGMAVEYFDS